MNKDEETPKKTLLEGHFVRKDQSKNYTEVMARLKMEDYGVYFPTSSNAGIEDDEEEEIDE